MKIGKVEINVQKVNPVVTVKKDNKPLFYIEKTQSKKPVIKNKRLLTGIVSGALATAILIGGISGCVSKEEDKDLSKFDSSTNFSEKVSKKENNSLDFKTMNYGSKTFLTLDEEDLLELIEQAMKEVDAEYLNNGNKTVFNSKDSEYSQFTKHQILGLLFTESSLRLLEIKDKEKGLYNPDNYARFYGTDKAGVIYYGPGMMNEQTVKYIVETDRLQVNNFKNYEYFEIDEKQVKITYENLNPYDYVINSGAKTQAEIEKALSECISLNVKCIYTYLNRIVKDNVKAGTHDKELKALESYSELKNLTTEEKQIAFALIGYNNGPTITRSKMLDGKLFEKNKAGEYIINVKYASKVMNKASDYISTLESDLAY